MACLGCGQRQVGFSAATAHVLGQDNSADPVYVQVKQANVLPNVRVGEYRWVTGTGVEQAMEEGLIIESGARPTPRHLAPQEVWCVRVAGVEKCFRTQERARSYSKLHGQPMEHKRLSGV